MFSPQCRGPLVLFMTDKGPLKLSQLKSGHSSLMYPAKDCAQL